MTISGFETPVATPEWKTNWWQRLLNIRNKIIVPYLVITIFVAAVGTYIVTRLVAGSLQERLSNQLAESSRVAVESIIRREDHHLETLRLVAFSSGMEEAIRTEDSEYLELVIAGLSANSDIPDIAVLDVPGRPLAAIGSFAQPDFLYDQSQAIRSIYSGQTDTIGDKYGEVLLESDDPLFVIAGPVLTAAPEEELVGVVVVATPLRTLLGQMKLEALSDITAYTLTGDLTSSTFIISDQEEETLALSANEVEEQLEQIRRNQESDTFEVQIRERRYQGMYAPLRIRGQTVGLLAVYLPSDFIVLEGGTSAQIFAIMFGLAALVIVLIGFVIASNIVRPIGKLVTVSQNVTAGDLTQRSTLKSRDEVGFLGFTFDIMTERLEYRTQLLEITIEALKAETARLSSILKASKTGMVMIDNSGQLSFINQSARTFLEPVLRPSSKLIEYLNELEPRDVIEINNYILAVEVTEVASTDDDNLGILVALQDITQQELAGRLKDRFIARVSHELRTPLTAIKGYSDLVKATIDFGKPPKIKHVTEIIQQTELLDQMIVQLLAISQMSAGTFSVRRSKMDLYSVLIEAVDYVSSRLDDGELELEIITDGQTEYIIQGDRERLRWAFDHLLDNAIKYTLPGGKIECRLSTNADNQVKVIVKDTGLGIRPIDQPHIFDAYYRREAVASDGAVIDPRGLGLGLYVVRNVIDAHGGSVSVDSTVGEGSTFYMELSAT